jgi:hypothetical protein
MKNPRICYCDSCVYSRKVHAIVARRDSDELIALIKELMDHKYCIEEDLSYYRCILDGSWGSSIEILERALVRAKTHPNLTETFHLP